MRILSGAVDGVAYPQLFVGNAFFGDPGIFNLFGATVTIPRDAATGTVISFPFSTDPRNHLVGYLDSGRTQRAFDIGVSGSGTASVPLHLDGVLPDGTPFSSATQVRWIFGAQVAPTPEPTSASLFGLACLGLAAGRFLKRQMSG